MSEQIVTKIGKQFRTFGGGRGSYNNPMAAALKDKPLQFAACVDVAEVVAFVLKESGHDKLLELGRRACFLLERNNIKDEYFEVIRFKFSELKGSQIVDEKVMAAAIAATRE